MHKLNLMSMEMCVKVNLSKVKFLLFSILHRKNLNDNKRESNCNNERKIIN